MRYLKTIVFLTLTIVTAGLIRGGEALPIDVIPRPASVVFGAGTLPVSSNLRIEAPELGQSTAKYLRREWNERFAAAAGADATAVTTLWLQIAARTDPDDESYTLVISADSIRIKAASTAGLFYGGETLLQLVDGQIGKGRPQAEYRLPALTIADRPRFAWRGFMLDEARHFFGPATVMKLLDTMAYLKLNRLHWHLTDDRWRIEITQYPKLTSIGAVGNTSDPTAPAAFYTQDDIRKIVRYASDRHIVIVPEIEMPGHARGATVAYPELAGGDDTDPKAKWFTYNPASPSVEKFLAAAIDETISMFPGPYFHIGGDETYFWHKAWANRPEVKALMAQANLRDLNAVEDRFMHRMAAFVADRGKIVLGWEIAKTGLPPSEAMPIWWHDQDRRSLAEWIGQGYRVILCPHAPTYFDFVQASNLHSGRVMSDGAVNSLAAVYAFPDSLRRDVPNLDRAYGLQAALWSEQVHTPERLWFQIFPRLTALAEDGWTPAGAKDYADFCRRMPGHFAYLRRHGINFYNPLQPEATPEVDGPMKSTEPNDRWAAERKAIK